MDTPTYDIQGLVAESGVPRRTIHFYVQQGILPPPQGAGLAAVYGEEHRLRLALIPILRKQGLRLDQIRQRFGSMALEEMRQVAASQPPTAEAAALRSAPQVRASLRAAEAAPPRAAALRGQKRYLHYPLQGGITLVVPETLSEVEQRRVELLLQAASRILAPNYAVYSQDQSGDAGAPSV